MIAINHTGDSWEVSLYSDHEEVDCANICKTLGGGGHKGAAGFIADTQTLLKLGLFV